MDNLPKRSFGLTNLVFLLAILLIVSFCGCIFLSFVSFPPTESIAQNYFNAVVQKNLDAVLRLGGPDYYCQNELKDTALHHIEQYGGAEIRGTTISVESNTGSDDELQWAIVKFEYRQANQAEWAQGKIVLMTDHAVPGFRYTCGGR